MLEVDVAVRQGAFDLNARFESGAGVTALFGHSGAGKTTLIKLIGGLLRPHAGRIVVGGRTLFDSKEDIDVPVRNRRVGFVFQEGRLFPHLTVRQNLLYGRFFTPPNARRAHTDDVVEMLGIGGLLGRRPGSLSGGEKQRVAIGRALLADPQILLMDEPLASLDQQRKAEILPYVERLRDEAGTPIVYVSHSVDEVARLANEIVVMSEGRIQAVGSVQDVMARLDLSPYTGRFEAGAVIDAQVRSQDARYGLTELALGNQILRVPALDADAGTILRLRVRARDVALAVQRPIGISIRNVLAGRVLAIGAEGGAFAEVSVEVEGQTLRSRVTRQSVEELALAPGMPVFVLVKTIAFDRRSLNLAPPPETRSE
jgi:molybdate transport system ATP-binding protein